MPNRRLGLLQIGQSTGFSQGVHYVTNSQVLFAVDVAGLPPRASITQINHAQIRLNVIKVSTDQYTSTEMLCLLGDGKVCSGDVYEARTWLGHINPAFFPEGGPHNRTFAQQYLTREVGRLGTRKLYAAELILDVQNDFLTGSPVREALDLIYGSTPPESRLSKRTLHFAVADDTYVSDAQILLGLEEDTCKTADLGRLQGR